MQVSTLKYSSTLKVKFRYPHTILETIAEEWPNDQYVCNMRKRDWRNTLKKVPTNGELFIRKKVVPR